MAGDMDALWVAAKLRGVLINPGHGTAYLVTEYREIAADIRDAGRLRYHAMCSGINDRLGYPGKATRQLGVKRRRISVLVISVILLGAPAQGKRSRRGRRSYNVAASPCGSARPGAIGCDTPTDVSL